jgi:hypothetical protein
VRKSTTLSRLRKLLDDLLKAARRVTVQHMAHIARDYEGVDGAARYPHVLAGFGGQLLARDGELDRAVDQVEPLIALSFTTEPGHA